MDESTFSDPNLINYINKNFYALKFDAESVQSVNFKGKDYPVQTINNRKVHQLAWDWGNVNGRIGYPTIVILDQNLDKLQAFPGFKDVEAMTSLAKFYGEGIYKNKSWQDYLSGGK
jgi:thioredoxin-related protein